MILQYGTYRHAVGEAGLAIARENVFAPDGEWIATRERWRVEGVLQAESPAELTTAIERCQAAYALTGRDARLLLPDGQTPTAHRLLDRESLGGVRVVRPPSFPEGRGAEYTTFRSYALELEAEFPVDAAAGRVMSWDEVLNFSGGGPRWTYLATLAGPPVRQLVQRFTTFRVWQRGRAIGFDRYPAPAAPLWPAALHADLSQVTRRLPRRAARPGAGRETEFEVTWSYQFESIEPLIGDPTPRR